ncbi:hypothetical protein D3C80_1937000 [compost metagenome]
MRIRTSRSSARAPAVQLTVKYGASNVPTNARFCAGAGTTRAGDKVTLYAVTSARSSNARPYTLNERNLTHTVLPI